MSKKVFRIIPKLEIKNHNLVKGINLEGLRALGRADIFAEYYFNNGADEIIYQDIVASLYGKNSLEQFILKTAKKIFIPLTVGGGLRSNEDIRKVLNSGADKVSINSKALVDIGFIKKAIDEFGSSTVSINVEAKLNESMQYEAFYDNGRTPSGIMIKDWLKIIQDLNVGEIIMTSVDYDGLGNGADTKLLDYINGLIYTPFIYSGGISDCDQIVHLVKKYNYISGVSISSLLHYSAIDHINKDYKNYGGNFEFLQNKKSHKKFKNYDINKIKKTLLENNIFCRV